MNIFDYVGKFEENFDEHVKVLLKYLGLNCNIDIPIWLNAEVGVHGIGFRRLQWCLIKSRTFAFTILHQ